MIALDASALLSFMFRETGHERVVSMIDESCISSVNVAEVLGRFSRDGHNARRVLKEIQATPIEMVTFDAAQALIAAELVTRTSEFGLSLGDRACLALAISRRIPAMTADQIWTRLDVGVDIRVIR
jgi:ribonuclease VapC